MPPKTKRLRSLQESARRAREGMKQARIEVEAGSSVNPEQEVTLLRKGHHHYSLLLWRLPFPTAVQM